MAIFYRAPSTTVPSPRCFTSKRIIIVCSSSFPSQWNQIRLGVVSSSASLHLQSENPIRFLTPAATNYSLSPEKKKKDNLSRSVTVASIRSGEPAVVTGATWDEYVLKSDVPVLVEFWAAWCGPCTMVHREIEEIAKEYVGRINCYKLKVDDDLELTETYNIKGVPVVMMFKNGKQQDSVIGTMPKYIYVKAIEKLLTS